MFKLRHNSEEDFTKIHDDTLPINDFTTKGNSAFPRFADFSNPITTNATTNIEASPTTPRPNKKALAIILLFYFFLFICPMLVVLSDILPIESWFLSINPFRFKGDASLVSSLMYEDEVKLVEDIVFEEQRRCYAIGSETCLFDIYNLTLKNGNLSKAYVYTTDDDVKIYTEIAYTNTYDIIKQYDEALNLDSINMILLVDDSLSRFAPSPEKRSIILFVDDTLKNTLNKAYFETFHQLCSEIRQYLDESSSDIDEIEFIVGFKDGTFINGSTETKSVINLGFLLRSTKSYTYAGPSDSPSANLNTALVFSGPEDFINHQKSITNHLQLTENLTDELIEKVIDAVYTNREKRL